MDFEYGHFDEMIKARLGELKVPYHPDHWDKLDQQLTQDAILNPDKGDNLDEMIAKGLGNLSVPMATANWDLFEEKLEASEMAEANDASIDELTYEKLHDYKVSYNSAHWLLMAERLEEAFSLRRKLYRYKVAEIALMLLFLITLVNYLPLGKKIGNQVLPAYKKHQEFKQPQLPLKTAPANEQVARPIAATESAANNEATVLPANSNNKSVRTTSNTQKTAEEATPPTASILPNAQLNSNLEKLPPLSIDDIVDENVSSIKQAIFLNNEKREGGNFISGGNINRNTVLLAALDNPDLKLLENGKYKLPKLKTSTNKTKGQFRFNIFAATDANYIYKPYVELLNYGQATPAGALGYGGGLTASYKKGRWQVEFGGIYTFKRYNPDIATNIFFIKEDNDIEVKENLNAIQLDLLEVPLNFQYYFLNRNKWRMYTTAGATLNMVTTAIYEIKTQEKILPVPAPPGSASLNKSIRESEDFNKGILEGGRLKDNHFMTANLGFGIERSISNKWSLFFQPNYKQYVSNDGLGPNRVKINSLSFYLGTRVNIK